MRKANSFLVVVALGVPLALVAGERAKKLPVHAVMPENVVVSGTPFKNAPAFNYVSPMSAVGSPTSLGGFHDYQSNGGGVQHIRVNPANGNIHVTMMTDVDSPLVTNQPNRRTVYAYSTNNGVSWNNFTNIRVPDRRSGFPTLDLGQGAVAGAAIIGNHSAIGSTTLGTAFIDFPEGAGLFNELTPPTGGIGGDPIWPFVGGTTNGGIVMATSPNVTGGQTQYSRTSDFISWTPYVAFPGTSTTGGRYPVHANGTGRVGIMMVDATTPSIQFLESTNNGTTWPATSQQVRPSNRVVGPDTFQNFVGGDFCYNGNTPLFVFEEQNSGANTETDSAQITFWSAATGYKVVASPVNTPNVPGALNKGWVNYPRLGTPAIAMSGTAIVIVYNAVQRETSAAGFNYSDIFMVQSTNGGTTWSAPRNVTQTSNLEERYPSLSVYNPTGFVHMVFQEDYQPGPAVFNGTFTAAPLSRVTQKYLRISLSGASAEEPSAASSFSLSQNYPNPFNPATKIDYAVGKSGPVTIKVFNALGQEVATLLDQSISAGAYQVAFDGSNMPSGVYVYTIRAGNFTTSKKMVLMK